MLRYLAMGAVQMANDAGAGIPIALHLDHGDSFELAKSCIDSGFSSVMLNLITASISVQPGMN